MSYLIDTDIVIYSLKGDERVTKNFHEYRNSPKSLSVITYGELVYGAKKSTAVEKNLARAYRIAEVFPIIDITPAVVGTFGAIKTALEQEGNIVADMDLLIAATALTHNLILVTNNQKHFGRINGLDIENWAT